MNDQPNAALPALIVIAKAPVAGSSKTRLTPPCSPDEAADIARAALEDTLATALATPASEHVLVLEGDAGTWLPDGFTVIPQRGDGLDERLAAAFEDAPTPALLIGMDTPQVTTDDLRDALVTMQDGQAVLGAAPDGGYWAIGLQEPNRALLQGVPMSTSATVAAQRTRFAELSIPFHELPEMRDVDTFEDAVDVATAAPATSFASAVAAVEPQPRPRSPRRARAVTLWALAAWALLILVAWQWGNAINDSRPRRTDMLVQAPPFTGHYVFGLSLGILAAVAMVVLAGAAGPWVIRRLSWRTLLWVAMLCSAAWILALVLGDPVKVLTSPVRHRTDYLRGVSFVNDDILGYLRAFTDRIAEYPSHVRSHPPGVVAMLQGLRSLGLGSPNVIAGIFVAGGAAAIPAVLIAMRDVAGETRARAAAPFLVLAPAALWMGTSADALFAGVGAWAVALLVLSTSRTRGKRVALAIGGGTLFGIGMFFSYGFVLLAVVPMVVAWKRKALVPLLIATGPVLIITLAWTAAGFWWLDGLQATREQYELGVSQDRPYTYFLVANLAALAVAVGPAVAVGFTHLRGRAWWLVGGALAAVAIADVSGMSKAEVERIWLPFAVWLLLACAPLGRARWAGRGWLAAQGTLAVIVQIGLDSPW